MGIAALILSIISFFTALTIFKDFSLILGVIAIVLGIISLVRKKGKVVSIIAIVLTIIGLVICFTSNGSKTTVTGTSKSSDRESVNDSKSDKTYGLNEELTIKTSSDEYTLVITGIEEMTQRNEFSDKNFEQIFLIDYTYKDIKSDDTIYINSMNFKIIDSNGETGDTYPNSVSSEPKSITGGTTCKAQMVFGVNNKSDKIKLQFFDNYFSSDPDAVFELDV